MMHHVRAIAIILFTLTVASASVATSLRAQSIAEFAAIKPAANSGAIDGTVIDTSGNGLAGVEVLILDNKQSVRTNGGGISNRWSRARQPYYALPASRTTTGHTDGGCGRQ